MIEEKKLLKSSGCSTSTNKTGAKVIDVNLDDGIMNS